MTASKNPENITVQLLSSFGHCPSTSSRMAENPTHFYKNVDFSSSSRLFTSAECLKSVKSIKNEEFQAVEN